MADNASLEPIPVPPQNHRVRRTAFQLLRPPAPVSRPTRLLLACHAESVRGQTTHLGPYNVGLSARGWEETTALAHWLQNNESIDVLLADGSLRARLTAQSIGQSLGLTVSPIALPGLGEPEWTLTPPLFSPDGSELDQAARYAAYSKEMLEQVERLLVERWGKTVLFVAESVFIATLVRGFMDAPELGIEISTTSITEVRFGDERWSLRYLNCTEHLPRRAHSASSAAAVDGEPSPDVAAELAQESEQAALFYSRVAEYLEKNTSQATERRSATRPEVTGEMIRDFAGLDSESHLLFVGAGSGQLALELAQAGISEVVGVDVSPGMLERAEFARLAAHDQRVKGVNFRLAAAHALPFADGRFDVALCVHLLHHLSRPLPALREIYRVLPDHGKLIVIDVDGAEDAVKRATQNVIESKRNPNHAALRTQSQWVALLEKAGFSVENEMTWQVKRRVDDWLNSAAVDGTNRGAVIEMLEASIETDAAGLLVEQEDDALYFQLQVFALLLRKHADG